LAGFGRKFCVYLACFSRAFVWGKPWVNRSALSNSGAVSDQFASVQIVSQQRHQLAKINRHLRDTKGGSIATCPQLMSLYDQRNMLLRVSLRLDC
jgi:hypothetical protein